MIQDLCPEGRKPKTWLHEYTGIDRSQVTKLFKGTVPGWRIAHRLTQKLPREWADKLDASWQKTKAYEQDKPKPERISTAHADELSLAFAAFRDALDTRDHPYVIEFFDEITKLGWLEALPHLHHALKMAKHTKSIREAKPLPTHPPFSTGPVHPEPRKEPP